MARAIQVAVRLGLPDLLANRPKELSDLALATASDRSTLHRLLRCLKHLGIVVETSPELYSGTSLSQRLQRDGADALYWLAMLYGEEWQLQAWEQLEDSMRTGASGVSQAFGTDLWTYLDQHPESAEVYNRGLSGLGVLNDQIASIYDFSRRRARHRNRWWPGRLSWPHSDAQSHCARSIIRPEFCYRFCWDRS